MGSNSSKAVRWPHVSRTAVPASTPTSAVHGHHHHHNHHHHHYLGETRPCQAPSLAEIQPLTPLALDIPTVNTAAADNDSPDNPPVPTTETLNMDPQPRVAPPVEHTSNADAVDSSSQILVADTEHNPPPEPPEITCIICCESGSISNENKHLAIKACRCGSTYCAPCLKNMFVAASKDLSRMPPRCCVQIPLYHVRPYLSQAEYTEFKFKYEEWSTPKPLYCPVPTCSIFIPSRLFSQARTAQGKQRVDSVIGTPKSAEIACPQCTTDICTKCRQLAHPNQMCENLDFGVDEDTAKLLKSWGYKRCPKCSNGVKRMFGCNHMQCLCGAHWCWMCQRSYDQCEGECYEEDEDYSDDEEDGEEEEQATQPPVHENAEAPVTAMDAITQPAEAPEIVSTRPIPRVRNLDARRRNYWEENDVDFGEEPEENYADIYWNCDHDFETVKVDFNDSLRSGPSTTDIECSKCWNDVHPEIEMPSAVNTGGARVIAGTIRGYSGRGRTPRGVRRRGRGRGRGRERGRGAALYTALVRGDATLGSATSEASHDELVVDTYGRMITTTEIDMERTRRASLDDLVRTDGRSPFLSSDTWQSYSHSQHTNFDDNTDHKHSPFSFAYQCHNCGLVVCNPCKDVALAEQEERDQLEAERIAKQDEEEDS